MSRHAVDLDLDLTHPNIKGVQGRISLSMEIMPEKEAQDDEVEEGRPGDLLTRGTHPGGDGVEMYTYYRPPGAFPDFGIMAIIKAKLAPLKIPCIICCVLLIVVGVLAVMSQGA